MKGWQAMRVLILAAITVDGKIARGDAEFTGWSSREDKRLFARTSREAGAVVMGRRTFETLPAPLPGRLNIVMSHDKPAVAVDGVEYTAESPEQVIASLTLRGYESVVIGGGASVYRAFLQAQLVDELWLTVEPLTFGSGISLLGDAPLDLRLSLLSVERLGEASIHLRYSVEKT
jgi:dihydrofolate reductase